ncbi:MAG: hypothetical protein EHM78_01975 [Myxococcaceae bacterium]|nr:MAG: hypothetical protein EHM78_01975 [Myxococcaceae bacterium]
MAKPNKTVGRWSQQNPRPHDPEAEARHRARMNPDMRSVMEAVGAGTMTVAEGVAAMQKINGDEA